MPEKWAIPVCGCPNIGHCLTMRSRTRRPAAPNTKAIKALAKAKADALAEIARIQAAVEKIGTGERIDWRDVGDAAHARDSLKELADTLEGIEE